jgi:hypothetical protein
VKKFVLVGGMPRSGTTLLETVIGSNSKIAMPPGDFPFAELFDKRKTVEEIFATRTKKQVWERWEVKDFSSLFDKSYGEAFYQSMVNYAAGIEKEIPAAKSPYTEFFL